MNSHPHSSREIAEAMIAELMPRYPQPVELPLEKCPRCEGTGDMYEIGPVCGLCHGAGTVRVWCCFCKSPATTIVFDDDGHRFEMCNSCGLSDDPADRAIAWGLRQGMAAVMEAVR